MKSLKSITTSLFLLTLGLTIVNCSGQSSDPLKDYGDVKAVPAHDKKGPEQTTAEEPFRIAFDGPNEINYANFIEGKENKINVRVIPRAQYQSYIKDYKLEIISADSTDLPKLKKTSENIYELSWTPRAGTILNGSVKTVSFEMFATVSNADDARLNGLTTAQTMFINITKEVNKDPKIVGIDGWKKNATEGDIFKFKVRIEDPNFEGNGSPKLNYYSFITANIEAYKGDAKEVIRLNNDQKPNPVYNGGNSFTYFYVVKLNDLPEFIGRREKVNSNAKMISLCADFEAYSVAKTASGTRQECVAVKYNAQPAALTLDATSADKKIYAGQETEVSFTLSTVNGLSTIAKLDETSLKGITTASSMLCEDSNDDKGTLKCSFKWAPKCLAVRAVKTYPNVRKVTINFKLKTTLNKITKTSDAPLDFEVIDTEESCKPVPKSVDGKSQTENKGTVK